MIVIEIKLVHHFIILGYFDSKKSIKEPILYKNCLRFTAEVHTANGEIEKPLAVFTREIVFNHSKTKVLMYHLQYPYE